MFCFMFAFLFIQTHPLNLWRIVVRSTSGIHTKITLQSEERGRIIILHANKNKAKRGFPNPVEISSSLLSLLVAVITPPQALLFCLLLL